MKYRIIIADDEKKILQLIKKLGHWEELGIEIVDECSDGQEALDSILRNRPDIVLSDIKMPVYDGIRLIEKTREQGVDTLFVLLSGYRHFEYARSALQLNVMDYLLKPIDEVQLNDTLEKVCLKVEQKRKIVQWKELEKEHTQKQMEPFWDMIMYVQDEILQKKNLETVAVCNEKFGTEFREGCFQIISTITNLNSIMEYQDSIFNDKVDGFVHRIFDQIAVHYSLTTYKGRLIILNFREEDREQIKNGISALFCNMRDLNGIYGDFRLNFGYSGIKQRVSELGEAYRESEIAKWGRLIFIGNTMIDYSQVTHLARFSVEELISEKEVNRISECIRYVNREGLGEQFSMLYQRAASLNNAYPGDMREAAYVLMIRMRNSCSEQEWREKMEPMLMYSFVEARSFQMLIKNVYLKLDAYMAEEEKQMKEKLGKPMGEAVRFMKEHYRDAISLEDAASAAGVSAGYLGKLFKREMDIGFNEYLTQIRLEKSQELLAETAMSIKEIASMVGYPDEKYYSKLFKKVTGIKPTDYRRLYGG